MRFVFVLTLLAAAMSLSACRADLEDLQVATVEQVVAWKAEDPSLVFCDANTPDTRDKYGAVPGALKLSNYRDYDVRVELPEDRTATLVFYCHSDRCGAAGDAARKAVAAGYGNVWVMATGIVGWRDARQPVEGGRAS